MKIPTPHICVILLGQRTSFRHRKHIITNNFHQKGPLDSIFGCSDMEGKRYTALDFGSISSIYTCISGKGWRKKIDSLPVPTSSRSAPAGKLSSHCSTH